VEDTGSIISDYTEDDIDLPNDEPMDANDQNNHRHQHHNLHEHIVVAPAYSGTTIATAATVGSSHGSTYGQQQQQQNTNQTDNENNGGNNYHQRHRSTSLSRNGVPVRDMKRTRTRSIDLIDPAAENKENANQASKRLSVNASPGGTIKAITTISLNEDGRPTAMTSEIEHRESNGRLSQGQVAPAKVELAFIQPATTTAAHSSQQRAMRNRKKRPSREFLHRSADESEVNEESESFWSRSILEEVDTEIAGGPGMIMPHQPLHIMTPIVEQPTPTVSESSAATAGIRSQQRGGATYSGYKKTAGNVTPSYKMAHTPFKPNSMMLPLAKKYKKAHSFNRQAIINQGVCAHCDKKTKFGKLIMKCRECDMVCHTECKDLVQRACLSTLNFPAQGKFFCLHF
jgi:hypothetical protein